MQPDLALPPDRPPLSTARARADSLSDAWWPWLALEIALLVLAGWRCFDNIFYDTVAYLRLAQYYLDGRLDLAINGYWGPLMSWLMAPLLALTGDHLLTVRLVMGASALGFFCAALRVLRRLDLPPAAFLTAAALLIPFTVCWSVALATPDLLMSAIVLTGLGLTLTATPDGAGRRPLVAGLIYGCAYLAKAVALPTAILLVGVLALVRWLTGAAARGAAVRSAALSVAGIALVAAPWVIVLSLHYGAPTVSTSAAIAHATVGPDNPDRFHAFHHMFQAPDPGRITTWEDPSRLPYPYWSPLRSAEALRHQIKLVGQNTVEAVRRVSGFDWLGIGLVSALVGFLMQRRARAASGAQRWRLAGPVIAATIVPYLPSYPDATRYYLLAYPLLLAAALGFLFHDVVGARAAPARTTRRLQLVAVALVGLSFTAGLRHELIDAFAGATDPAYRTARAVVPLLRSDGEPGPLISVDDYSVAYFAAFLLGWPFYGDKIPSARVDEVVNTGARFLITRRVTPFARALERDTPPGLERLPTDPSLPVAVYRVRRPDAPAGVGQRRL